MSAADARQEALEFAKSQGLFSRDVCIATLWAGAKWWIEVRTLSGAVIHMVVIDEAN